MVIIKQNYLVIKRMFSSSRPQSSPLKALPHRIELRISTPSDVQHQEKKKETCQGKVVIHTGVLVMESFLVTDFYPEAITPSDGKQNI